MAGVTYTEHLEWLDRQVIGACRERQGFVDAQKLFSNKADTFDSDYEQQRYQQGFDDGKIMLAVEEAR